jgi:uncharacterized membrane protein
MLGRDLFGLPIPDAGPVFTAALALHIASGLTAVIAGALAATANKKPGRHPRAGHIYLWALGGVFVTAAIMATIRWHEDAHLFAIAVIAFGLGRYGYRARRHHRPGWPRHHGPFLPIWNRLPPITYWLLPSLVGVPLTWRALHRFADVHTARDGEPGTTR